MYPQVKFVADRLFELWSRETLGIESKGLRLPKPVFNRLCGRSKIEDVFLRSVDRQLRKRGLRVFRIGATFAVADASALEAWPEPQKASIDRALEPPMPATAARVLTVRTRSTLAARSRT